MEIEFFGANCFRIKTKETTIVVDDNLSKLGGKTIQNDKTVAFYSNADLLDEKAGEKSRLMFDTPGEYEVGDVTVTGVPARSHMDEEEKLSAVVYQYMYKNQTVTVMGHVHPDISDEVAEFIAGTDVLVVPVGGNGFTLDPVGANKVMKKAEASVVIPSHFDMKGLKFEVPAQPLEEFGNLPNVDLNEPQDSFKMSDVPGEDGAATSKVVVLKAKIK